MGSFAPQPKPHTFDLSWTEAPTGLLARGEYKGKGLVNIYLCSFWMVTVLFIASSIIFVRLQVIGEYISEYYQHDFFNFLIMQCIYLY